MMNLKHHLTRSLSRVLQILEKTLKRTEEKFRSLRYQLNTNTDDDNNDFVIEDKFSEWKEASENQARMETIRWMFEEMEEHELDYFKHYCIDELQRYPDTLAYIANMISEAQQCLLRAEINAELEMHCETDHVFAFLFNKLGGAVSSDTFPSFTANTFRYKQGLSEEFIAGFEYEIKRRFASELEKELPKHDTPKQKRTKI